MSEMALSALEFLDVGHKYYANDEDLLTKLFEVFHALRDVRNDDVELMRTLVRRMVERRSALRMRVASDPAKQGPYGHLRPWQRQILEKYQLNGELIRSCDAFGRYMEHMREAMSQTTGLVPRTTPVNFDLEKYEGLLVEGTLDEVTYYLDRVLRRLLVVHIARDVVFPQFIGETGDAVRDHDGKLMSSEAVVDRLLSYERTDKKRERPEGHGIGLIEDVAHLSTFEMRDGKPHATREIKARSSLGMIKYAIAICFEDKFRERLARCKLPSCRRYFLRPTGKAGGVQKYCHEECRTVAHKAGAVVRVREWREDRRNKRRRRPAARGK